MPTPVITAHRELSVKHRPAAGWTRWARRSPCPSGRGYRLGSEAQASLPGLDKRLDVVPAVVGLAEVGAEAKPGRMDGAVVEAVPGTAGHRVARRSDGPAGLTAREVDVLRLVSPGLSSKEVAAHLVISPKTARNHMEHIYGDIGASNRAGASLLAMQHGLIPGGDLITP